MRDEIIINQDLTLIIVGSNAHKLYFRESNKLEALKIGMKPGQVASLIVNDTIVRIIKK